jgi:uncharacterized membrane protein
MLNVKEETMKKWCLLGLFMPVLLSLTGCELLLADAAMDFNLSLEPAQVTMAKGETKEIKIKVSRILPVNIAPTPITVTLYNPPTGVSLKDGQVEIPNGIDERALVLQVDSSAKAGEVEITIEGTSGLKTKQTKLKLTVN